MFVCVFVCTYMRESGRLCAEEGAGGQCWAILFPQVLSTLSFLISLMEHTH